MKWSVPDRCVPACMVLPQAGTPSHCYRVSRTLQRLRRALLNKQKVSLVLSSHFMRIWFALTLVAIACVNWRHRLSLNEGLSSGCANLDHVTPVH